MTKTVTFEKIVGGGKAMGHADGKPCFASGPLPGETCVVELVKDKPGFAEAVVVSIADDSSRRSGAAEAHYLSCSPWQNVDYEYQLKLKKVILTEAFGRLGFEVPVKDLIKSTHLSGYRNKLEFSLKPVNGQLELAFHARGSYEDLVVLPEGCKLGHPAMNAAALKLAKAAHAMKLDGYIETLTVRRSEATGALLGHIALHQVPKRDWSDLKLAEFAGVVVSRVRRRVEHELVWTSGQTTLTEKVGGLELSYPYDGFFQTNIPMFEKILENIITEVPAAGRLIDLYGGVGTIGLSAAGKTGEVVGVEINASSVELAKENAASAGITNYRAIQSPAQRLDSKMLMEADCIIVDPPRAGLELRVVNEIMAAAPQKIIYLSCNPVTQARDWQLLSEAYQTDGVTGYDMYPGTLHLESLMIFERK
ncbi:MAG: 23S rRNA (uracil(1939)-C(5))-methyltransferase RlmD [Candidatus Saccharimonadales bacterium]